MPHMKNGADWFKFDVAFFSGQEIRKLKLHYGSNGIETYIRLLCAIFSEGYFVKFDDDLVTVLSLDVGVKENFIRQVISFLAKGSLLDGTLFSRDKALTSREIQLRYQELVNGRAKKRLLRNSCLEVDGRYWLLNENETDTCIKVRRFSDLSETNTTLSETNTALSGDISYREEKNRIEQSRLEKNAKGDVPLRGQPDERIDFVMGEYSRLLPAFPTAELTDKLKSNIAKSGKADSDYTRLFEAAAKSGFLCSPKSNWQCNIEWLTEPANMEKVLAGKYADFQKPSVTANKHEAATTINGVESGFDTESFFEAALRRGKENEK